MQKKLSQLPTLTVVSSADCCEVSRYITDSQYTSSKATMGQLGDFVLTYHGVKKGRIPSSSFTGSPRNATVTFSNPYTDLVYEIIVTGEDSRVWTIISKTTTGFSISSNSNVPLSGSVYWRAEKL